MAISRVPGYSLLANLDRQGTDLYISSDGQNVTYWDVVNRRFGINTDISNIPQEALEVVGNILVSNGHAYTSANLSYDIGSATNYWRTGYFGNLAGTLLTNAQPNITSVGTLNDLTILGNLSVSGVTFANVSTTGNLNAGNNQIIWVGAPINSLCKAAN